MGNATQLAFVCLILGFSLETLAQCKQISGATNYSKFDEFGQPARKIHYFIEFDFHTELRAKTPATDDDTLTQAQMVRAIQEAAETWNNEALGQQLVYGGLVSVENPDQICTATTKRPVVFTFNHPYPFYPSDYGQPVQRWGLTSDDFSTITYGYGANFVRCSDISCSTSVPIRGFLPITSGYNPKTNTTMVIETRTQDSPSHTEIWVYPGFYNNYYAALLPGTKFSGSASQMDFPASGASWTYNARPHRSAVTACSDHTFEREFNCMLAWAEPGKSDGRILYSFYKHMPGQTPAIQFHLVDGKRKVYSRGSSDTVTTPGIAFFAGRYWLAFKQADATNTIAWSTFSSSGWSATATINASSHGFLADPPSFGYQHNKEAVMSWTVVE